MAIAGTAARLARSAAYAPPAGPIRIVHADAALLAAEKPAGLLTVPGKSPDLGDCLLARLADGYGPALLVHRLDRDTSGLVLFARTAAAQRHLGLQFERRGIAKTYAARVIGWPAEDAGTVDRPLAADWPNRPMQRVDWARGRPALTHWQVVARRADGTADLHLTPVTGRSHQLRVHMAEIGHPILGDPLYGPEGGRAPRMMLHAMRLCLRHPAGGAALTLISPAPF